MRGGGERRKDRAGTYIYVGAGRTCVLAPMTFSGFLEGRDFLDRTADISPRAGAESKGDGQERYSSGFFLPIPTFSVCYISVALFLPNLWSRYCAAFFRYYLERLLFR